MAIPAARESRMAGATGRPANPLLSPTPAYARLRPPTQRMPLALDDMLSKRNTPASTYS